MRGRKAAAKALGQADDFRNLARRNHFSAGKLSVRRENPAEIERNGRIFSSRDTWASQTVSYHPAVILFGPPFGSAAPIAGWQWGRLVSAQLFFTRLLFHQVFHKTHQYGGYLGTGGVVGGARTPVPVPPIMPALTVQHTASTAYSLVLPTSMKPDREPSVAGQPA